MSKGEHFHFFAIQNILQKERNKKMDSKNGLLLDFVVHVKIIGFAYVKLVVWYKISAQHY
jgi:hypothetical protein